MTFFIDFSPTLSLSFSFFACSWFLLLALVTARTGFFKFSFDDFFSSAIMSGCRRNFSLLPIFSIHAQTNETYGVKMLGFLHQHTSVHPISLDLLGWLHQPYTVVSLFQ